MAELHLDSALLESQDSDPRESVRDGRSCGCGAEQQEKGFSDTSLHSVSMERALGAQGREVERHHRST